MTQKQLTTVVGLAMLVGVGFCAPSAQAVPLPPPYIVTLTQVGSNVVAKGFGAIDLTGLSLYLSSPMPETDGIEPIGAYVGTGQAESVDGYSGFTGPSTFGSGGFTHASASTGDAEPVRNFVYEAYHDD